MNAGIRWRSVALLAGALMLPLAATGAPSGASTTVKFSKVQAATAAGALELYLSLRQAATAVCRQSGARYGLLDLREEAACVDSALEQAVTTVDIPAVSAVHARGSRQGEP